MIETKTPADAPGTPTLGRGRLFVLSGPSGVGKGTVLARLFESLEGVARSISATTRAPRPGEAEGRDYYFLSQEEFQRRVELGAFLEHAQYGPSCYGTLRAAVEAQRYAGLDVILEIEVQGALNVRAICPDAHLVFLLPPSVEELERRLRSRDTETPEAIARRLQTARGELEKASLYDFRVTNDEVSLAADALRCIIVAERLRNPRSA